MDIALRVIAIVAMSIVLLDSIASLFMRRDEREAWEAQRARLERHVQRLAMSDERSPRLRREVQP